MTTTTEPNENVVFSTPTPEMAGAAGVGAVPTSAAQEGAQAQAAVEASDWRSLPLTDARTGETFTFADYAGKTVLTRTMATWCTNCRRGQQVWRDNVLPQVDAQNVVFISLEVETNTTAAALAAYADSNNFPWRFAVATPELLQELVSRLGSTVTVPPSEPQWVMRPDGSLTGLISDRSAAGLLSLLNG
jgi:thiol-disulfide isomerase/thioredoxin